MGGHQVPGQGTGDDGYDEDGYDESQRAEILEATRNGPTDGTVMTNLDPDLGDSADEEESLDDIEMDADRVGETDSSVSLSRADRDEDEVQDEFDDGSVDDDELDDADDEALKP